MRWFILSLLLFWPVALWAQSQEEEDKGFITNLLEESLSTENQTVTIDGFNGVITGNPGFDRLTIADEDGVWLIMENAKLKWRQTALVFGAIDINEISADLLIIERRPVGEPKTTTPTAEATPFSLPELPLSVKVDGFVIERVALGETILGEAIDFTVNGSADLKNGEGSVDLTATRLDDVEGQFLVAGSYSNETQILDVNVDLQEAPNGIVSHMLGLPGDPSVELKIEGNGPITDFTASLSLATNGVERLSGTFTLKSENGTQSIDLAVNGDITPLLSPEYAEFFGPDVSLVASVQLSDDGAIVVDQLEMTADHFQLEGSAEIASTGWPRRLDLTGTMATPDGSPVLLPIAGEKVFVQEMQFEVAFDASVSDVFTVSFDLTDLSRGDLGVETIALDGSGIIRELERKFDANFTYLADGIAVGSEDLGDALGERINGVLEVANGSDGELVVDSFTLEGPGIAAEASGVIRTSGGPEIESQVSLLASDLGRFAGLIGLPLDGSGALEISSTVRPLDGIFDVQLIGATQDLAIGQDRIDPLLAGRGNVAADFGRDTTGTRVDNLFVETPAVEISGRAILTSIESDVALTAEITDLGLVEPSISGAAKVAVNASQNEAGDFVFDASGEIPDATLSGSGTYTFNDTGNTLQGQIEAAVSDLSTYARIAQRDIGGAIKLSAQGVLLDDGQRFDAEMTATTTDLQIGDERVDPLLQGPGRLIADLARVGTNMYLLKELSFETDALTLDAKGAASLPSDIKGELSANLLQPELIIPGVTGPISAEITASKVENETVITAVIEGEGIDVNADVELVRNEGILSLDGMASAMIASLKPFQGIAGLPLTGSISADVNGSVQSDLQVIDLDVSASGSDLGIGNPTVDQLIAGESSLSGSVERNGETFLLEDFAVETAEVQINADIETDGSTGTADFSAQLRDIGLFTDVVSGRLTTTGTAQRSAGVWDIDLDAQGPGGINAQVDGQIYDDFDLDLIVTGGGPLDLMNDAIAPRRISGFADVNLAIVGPPAVTSVSGTISTSGTRLTLPTFEEALESITGVVQLSNGNATVDMTAAVVTGGGIEISGPISLQAPFNGDISVDINNVVLRDPTLYETSVDGGIRVQGPLAGGATISGALELGETEVRVPSSSVGRLGELPEVIHIGESAAVDQTIARAGLTAPQSTEVNTANTGPAYRLDISVNAPSRIFIRGRGLDAELGGGLTLSGTTNIVAPIGQFDLIRGRLNILTQRFDLTEGSATIQGDFIPYIRLVAETEAPTGTNIRIIIEGPLSEPEIGLDSDPDLPPDEALAQLIFGRNLDEITPFQAVRLASAVSTLAGNGGGALNSFREDLGLDDFDIILDGDGNAAVRAGAYLGENLYTDVTVSSDGSTEINLNLDISPSVTAKGTVDSDGESSIGIFFERDY